MPVCRACEQDRSAKRFTRSQLALGEAAVCKQCERAAEAAEAKLPEEPEQSAEPEAPRCDHCGEAPAEGDSLLRCGRCKVVAYCSRDCQKAAWRAHKPLCARPVPAGAQPSPPSEAGVLLLDAARHGDLEDVAQALAAGASPDYRDANGNTGLHRACANGHTETVAALAAAGATHGPNAAGNLPLHWAVQNGHAGAVAALLQGFPDLDVLAQNEFGRGALTEAFAKGDEAITDALLSHQSASEERLLDMNTRGNANVRFEDETGAEAKQEDLDLAGEEGDEDEDDGGTGMSLYAVGPEDSTPLVLRELQGAEEGTVDLSADDVTGFHVWGSAVVLARWACSEAVAPLLRDQAVVELGAGCGLAGLAVAAYSEARSVTLTDSRPEAVANLRSNADVNVGTTVVPVSVAALEWTGAGDADVGVLLGADLVYREDMTALLAVTVAAMLAPGGYFVYVGPADRAGAASLPDALVAAGLEIVSVEEASEALRESPAAASASEERESAAVTPALALYLGELAHSTYSCVLARKASSQV